jgi:hypothetical protein
MELLRNHKYKFDELTISYLHEVKTQIESVIELCREGDISVHDVERIIYSELSEAYYILYELMENPIGDDDICHSMSDLAIQQEEIREKKKITDTVFDYIAFLGNTEKKELPEILKSDDYQQKRKSKMKTQSNVEHEGKESQKKETTASPQNSESPVTEPDTAINLPLNDVLEKLVIQYKNLLRRWNNGKYKCKNLRQFINVYAEATGENPTKRLILDYLVKEDGKPFSPTGIVTTLNSYGTSPERKKTKGRQRKGTHKKNSL